MMRALKAMRGPKVWATATLTAAIITTLGCGSTGGSSANVSIGVGVGVYGPPMYGPGPWRGYPYPGQYPPGYGGVWIGVPVCCWD